LSAANVPTMQLFISHVVQLAQPPAAAYAAPAAIAPKASLFAGRPSLTAVGLSAITAVALRLRLRR